MTSTFLMFSSASTAAGPPHGAQVEAAVLLARVGHRLRAVALRDHHHRRAMRLEQVTYESMRPAVVGPKEPEGFRPASSPGPRK